jgi:hypothetical protein
VGVREAIGRYYLEYDRIGGRLLQIPEDYRRRSAGLLAPDLAGRLEALEPACRSRTEVADRPCDVAVESMDERRFVEGLTADRDEAWRELSRLVQYQDRQALDLREFLERTTELRRLLADGGS